MNVFPLVRSWKSTVIFTLIAGLTTLFFSYAGITVDGMAHMSVPMMIFFFFPFMLVFQGFKAGYLSVIFTCLIAFVSSYISFSSTGLICAMIYLLPFLAVYYFVLKKEFTYLKCGLILSIALFWSGTLAFIFLKFTLGGDLFLKAGEGFANEVSKSSQRDVLLLSFFQTGVIHVKEDLLRSFFVVQNNQIVGITAYGVKEMLLSLSSSVTSIAYSFPALLVTNSIYTGFLALYLGLRLGWREIVLKKAQELGFDVLGKIRKPKDVINMRKKEDAENSASEQEPDETQAWAYEVSPEMEMGSSFPNIIVPSFERLYMKRGVGLKIGLFLLGYLPLYLSDSYQGAVIGQMMVAVFTSFFTLQGMTAMYFLQKKAGVKRGMRKATLVIVYILFSTLFLWMGVIDQMAGFRGLRPPLGQGFNKEE